MTQTNAAQDEPWWEEFTQNYGTESLRSLAKRFGTNPRRLRRAAQRCGLANEPPELLAAAERLGTCPDDSLASDIGVTPELVKGARMRRQIEAFNPKTLPKPKVRKPKKPKAPKPERPPRERYSRSEPIVPTVVVKRSRGRVETERAPSRVDEGAQKLADTLGRIRSEEAPASKPLEEGDGSRRRRVVNADRAEEMRGLKPSSLPSLGEGDGRTRRRRMPRVAPRKATGKEGGDDEPGGGRHSALAAARISKALSRAAAHADSTAEPHSTPALPRELSKPDVPPRFVAEAQPRVPKPEARLPHPTVEALVEEVQESMSPLASLASAVQESLSPVPSLASSVAEAMVEDAPEVVRRPLASQAEANPELSLWTAQYRDVDGLQLKVIAAPNFTAALERARDLGDLIAVQRAPTL